MFRFCSDTDGRNIYVKLSTGKLRRCLASWKWIISHGPLLSKKRLPIAGVIYHIQIRALLFKHVYRKTVDSGSQVTYDGNRIGNRVQMERFEEKLKFILVSTILLKNKTCSRGSGVRIWRPVHYFLRNAKRSL